MKDLQGFEVGEVVQVKTQDELEEEYTTNSCGDIVFSDEDWVMEVDDYEGNLGREAVISQIVEKESYIDVYLKFDGKPDSKLYVIPMLKHLYEIAKPPELNNEVLMAIAFGS